MAVVVHTSTPQGVTAIQPINGDTPPKAHVRHRQLAHAAVRGMQAIYRPGFQMAKAGAHLVDLQDGAVEQGELARDEGIDGPR